MGSSEEGDEDDLDQRDMMEDADALSSNSDPDDDSEAEAARALLYGDENNDSSDGMSYDTEGDDSNQNDERR